MSETYFDTFVSAVDACLDKRGILGEEQLVFPPRADYGYEATPRNSVTFGAMGVDGVHYTILKIDGEICDDSPVVQVGPMDFSNPYSLLGESLLDYFARACGVSMSEMETLFQQERSGQTVLAEFMKNNFDQSRLFGRKNEIGPFLHLIELQP